MYMCISESVYMYNVYIHIYIYIFIYIYVCMYIWSCDDISPTWISLKQGHLGEDSLILNDFFRVMCCDMATTCLDIMYSILHPISSNTI